MEVEHRRTRRPTGAAAIVLAVVLVAGCVTEPPSTRDFPLGDGRRYAGGERRYRLDLDMQKAGPGRSGRTRLELVLLERVETSRGRPSQVTVTVADARATGDDADGERRAALGRQIAIRARSSRWEIEFSGGALGIQGQVRAADLALLAHLMAPSEPKVPPLEGQPVPERANIRTGWSTERLDLVGSSRLVGTGREAGRSVARYESGLSGDAAVALEMGRDPAPSPADIANAPLRLALGCFFVLVLPCLVPGPYLSLLPQPTVDMTGPLNVDQQAVIHRPSGRILRLDGTGRARIGGRMPAAAPPRRGTTQPPEVLLISAAPVGIDLSWSYSERLTDPWPKDPIPVALLITAAAAIWIAVVLHIVVAIVYRRRLFR